MSTPIDFPDCLTFIVFKTYWALIFIIFCIFLLELTLNSAFLEYIVQFFKHLFGKQSFFSPYNLIRYTRCFIFFKFDFVILDLFKCLHKHRIVFKHIFWYLKDWFFLLCRFLFNHMYCRGTSLPYATVIIFLADPVFHSFQNGIKDYR